MFTFTQAFLIALCTSFGVGCGSGTDEGTPPPVTTPPPIVEPPPPVVPPPPPPPPTRDPVEVVIDGTGAYFQSVYVTVTGDWDGQYDASIGNVKLVDGGLEIRSDGRQGRGTLTIEGEEYYYDIVEDNMCEHSLDPSSAYKIDCFGFETGGMSASMIWYENTEVVTIEIGIVRSNTSYPDFDDGDRVPEDHPLRATIEQDIKEWNKKLARNKIYIEYKLTDIYFADAWSDIFTFGGHPVLNEISDVVYGWGGAGGMGGQALMARTIWPGMKTPTPVGTNIGGTMQHEVGHAMGLGHGIWGRPDWQFEDADAQDKRYNMGSIFPRFGHGWSGLSGEGVCGAQGSVMSYASRAMYTNSRMTCTELGYGPGAWGDDAGSLYQSDEAYALNRVRFSFSLIHNEHLYNRQVYVPPTPPEPTEETTGTDEPVVYTDCPRTGTPQTGFRDCMGHVVTSAYPEEGYIFFGDDDTTVVNWEVVIYKFDIKCAEIANGMRQPGICGPADKNSYQYIRDKQNIDYMNEVFERSGVHVNLDLVDIRYAYFTSWLNPKFYEEEYKVDAVLQFGGATSHDGVTACGWGGFDASFTKPLLPWGICSSKDLLHELGHTVGLAHGPYNSRSQATGYIFPEFGHGSGSVCPTDHSVMAYDVNGTLFSNSQLTCGEISTNGVGRDKPAGYRGMKENGDYGYDEAYSINRVRYNVAGINGETIILESNEN